MFFFFTAIKIYVTGGRGSKNDNKALKMTQYFIKSEQTVPCGKRTQSRRNLQCNKTLRIVCVCVCVETFKKVDKLQPFNCVTCIEHLVMNNINYLTTLSKYIEESMAHHLHPVPLFFQ